MIKSLLPIFILLSTIARSQNIELVRDIQLGVDDSKPRNLYNFNGELVFTFWTYQGTDHFTLAVSDGTTVGTYEIAPQLEIRDDVSPTFLNLNNNLIFCAGVPGGLYSNLEVYKSDLSFQGTQMIVDLGDSILTNPNTYLPVSSNPKCLVIKDNKLFFNAANALLLTNGNLGDTSKIYDSILASSVTPILFNDTIYFVGDTGSWGVTLGTNAIWKSDGTNNGTVKVVDSTVIGKGEIRHLFMLNNQLYFLKEKENTFYVQLWKTNGTSIGTVLVVDTFMKSFSPTEDLRNIFVSSSNQIYYQGYDNNHGKELFISDGTYQGTHIVKDIYPGISDGGASDFIEYNGTIFFIANNQAVGGELFKTDGTVTGTYNVIDINPGPNPSTCPINCIGASRLIEYNASLYFGATDANGYKLYKSDGTSSGTSSLGEIQVYEMAVVDNTLFISGATDSAGWELYKLENSSSDIQEQPRQKFDDFISTTAEPNYISFTSKSDEPLEICLFNLLGQQIADNLRINRNQTVKLPLLATNQLVITTIMNNGKVEGRKIVVH